MQKIKHRTFNGASIFYTEDGKTIKDISSISYGDVPDAVFTIVNKDGELAVYLPERNMQLVKLKEVIEKYNKIVYVVS